MQLILLCGGTGQRLWPFSNAACPKPFLKLLPSLTPDEAPISMIQRIWSQLKVADLAKHTLIATSSTQVSLIHEQLSSPPYLMIEPSCRDTYPALLLASLYSYTYHNTQPDDIIMVMPVDTYANQDFFSQLNHLESTLKNTNADLALIGITPTHPSEKYGYILRESTPLDSTSSTFLPYQKIHSFVEKPQISEAQALIEQGALWNSGILAFRLGFILDHLKAHALPLSYETLLASYETLPRISFDYEIVEPTLNKIVISYTGIWKDLGTWDTLCEILPTSIMGRGSMSSDCENVHLLNSLSIPIQVLGLSNIIIAATPNGILISDKSASTRVKEFNP